MDSIKRKIQKLKALAANDSGATAEERETAAFKAMLLERQYHINENEAPKKKESDPMEVREPVLLGERFRLARSSSSGRVLLQMPMEFGEHTDWETIDTFGRKLIKADLNAICQIVGCGMPFLKKALGIA